jgi:hypothetical protein
VSLSLGGKGAEHSQSGDDEDGEVSLENHVGKLEWGDDFFEGRVGGCKLGG